MLLAAALRLRDASGNRADVALFGAALVLGEGYYRAQPGLAALGLSMLAVDLAVHRLTLLARN